jgi:histone-lysine N-methyltransferase SETMAR
MIILAYDSQGVLVCHPVREGRTVNAQYYKSFLQYRLRRAVREKRPELLDNAIILHDNATSHTADTVRRCLQRWGWEVLQHPPYSPDLVYKKLCTLSLRDLINVFALQISREIN